jgi:probable F420-dependent oxidoreductase
MQPPEHTAESRQVLGPDKALNVVLPCVLSTDPQAARSAARRALSIYLALPAYQRLWAANGFDETDWADRGSDRLVDAFVAWGDVDALGERIAGHIDAGATRVLLGANNPDRSSTGPPWDLLEALAPS